MATWRELITQAMAKNGEDFSNLTACTLTDAELDVAFDDSYGIESGAPFTAWSANHVYFPICYDGAEWCGAAPRNPCGTACDHQGG